MWTRVAFSITRAPILSRRSLRVANSARASGAARGVASRRASISQQAADTADQMLQQGADLGPRRRLAGAQQDEAAVRRDQATIEGGAHLLALDGWQIEGG